MATPLLSVIAFTEVFQPFEAASIASLVEGFLVLVLLEYHFDFLYWRDILFDNLFFVISIRFDFLPVRVLSWHGQHLNDSAADRRPFSRLVIDFNRLIECHQTFFLRICPSKRTLIYGV